AMGRGLGERFIEAARPNLIAVFVVEGPTNARVERWFHLQNVFATEPAHAVAALLEPAELIAQKLLAQLIARHVECARTVQLDVEAGLLAELVRERGKHRMARRRQVEEMRRGRVD